MIYSSLGLLALLAAQTPSASGFSGLQGARPAIAGGGGGWKRMHTSAPLSAVPEWLTQPTNSGSEPGEDRGEGPEERIEMMTVRFINTASGKDVVAEVEMGSNLLFVGDQFGIKLPRACRTGLCGSCTCEVKDLGAIQTDSNPRAGFATIRACSTKCFLQEGQDEMVVDVYRMQNKVVTPQGLLVADPNKSGKTSDPMARFADNWEKDFRPSWSSDAAVGASRGQGQVGVGSDPSSKTCKQCAGSGRVACYTCLGRGRVLVNESGSARQCSLCVGMCQIGCPGCRGKGVMLQKSKLRA